jgi:hypothetical protein
MNRHCELSGSFGKCESKLVWYAVYMKVNSCLRLLCAKKCPHLVCKVSRCPNAQTVFSAVPALLPAYYLRAKCPASRPASRHAATLATCKKTENSALSLPATNMSGIVETQDARRLLATFNGVSTTTASTTEDGNPGSDLEAMLRAQRTANPPGAADHSPHSTDAFDQDLAFDPHEITDMVTKHNTVSKPGRALPPASALLRNRKVYNRLRSLPVLTAHPQEEWGAPESGPSAGLGGVPRHCED